MRLRRDRIFGVLFVSTFLIAIAVVPFSNLAQGNPVYVSGDSTLAIIESPQSKTYTTSEIPLVLTTGCHIWPSTGYYSVDGGSEIKINENAQQSATFKTTLHFADGKHTIHLRTGDMMHSCAEVLFTVNTTIPFITLITPENRVYNTSTVQLHFSLTDESVYQVTYNLDDNVNVTVRVLHPMPPHFPEELTWYPLTNLTDGQHHVTIYAKDDFGNGYSAETNFEVNTNPPSPSITQSQSPQTNQPIEPNYYQVTLIVIASVTVIVAIAVVSLVSSKKRKAENWKDERGK